MQVALDEIDGRISRGKKYIEMQWIIPIQYKYDVYLNKISPRICLYFQDLQLRVVSIGNTVLMPKLQSAIRTSS